MTQKTNLDKTIDTLKARNEDDRKVIDEFKANQIGKPNELKSKTGFLEDEIRNQKNMIVGIQDQLSLKNGELRGL